MNLGREFYIGCAVIGFALGWLLPLPVAVLVSIPAGFAFTQWYLNRRN